MPNFNIHRPLFITIWVLLLFARCSNTDDKSIVTFTEPVPVEITGYTGNIMEPFLSRDGSVLLFNNLNSAPENTNIHWATKVDDTHFQYQGEVSGINTESLEGVPSMDENNNLYFVSLISYDVTLSSLYYATFDNGAGSTPVLVPGVSKNSAGWVNFDVEVDPTGEYLYFADGLYNANGGPYEADLVIAKKNGDSFERLPNSAQLLENINTNDLEYAACISADGLELYFTRIELPVTASTEARIYLSSRQYTSDRFGKPQRIQTITGFSEAATITHDGQALYFHHREGDKFSLYRVEKLSK